MYRNVYYNYSNEEMILYTWDAQGTPITERYSYHPYYYVDTANEPDSYSIFGGPLKKRVFRKQFDRLRSIKDGATRIYHNLSCEQQFLIDHFGVKNATPDFMKFALRVFFLDIEVYSKGGFPTPKDAKDRINLITLYDTLTRKFYTWGLEKDYEHTRSDLVYTRCETESILLESFLQFWEKNYPDVFSGWNCVREDQRVWLNDRITTINKLSVDDQLYDNGRVLNRVNTGKKKQCYFESEFGHRIYCSEDHRFPVYYKFKDEYKYPATLERNIKDVTFNDIYEEKDLLDFYVKIPIRKNLNIGYNTKREWFQLLGFVYTDGTVDVKRKHIRYSSKYKDVCEGYTNIVNLCMDKNLSGSYEAVNSDGNFYKSISPSEEFNTVWLPIIHNGTKKELDVEALSKCSYDEFISFIAGMVDGDGWIEEHAMCICNYEKYDIYTLNKILELLQWNGVIANKTGHYVSINAIDQNREFINRVQERLIHTNRKDKINSLTWFNKKNTPSKKIKWYLYDDYYLVRITDVVKTDEIVEMCDIHTETNYFICNGLKTHNCEGFDIPYIINRIKRVLGENHAKRLSPVGAIFEKQFMGSFGKPTTKWVIYGISCLDYMELYKKFTIEKRESYKLDFIAEIEVGMNKVKYKYGKLTTLADEDWKTFVDYNIVDVDLLVHLDNKLNYIQLTRKLAYTGLTPLEAALGTLSVVTGCIALKASEEGRVIPTFEDDLEGEIEGGYVREPIRGLHDSIVSFDANSLYPNTMITLNLSPETKLGKIIEKTDNEVRILSITGKEYSLSPEKFIQFIKSEQVAISRANVMFTQKKRGLVPQIIEKLYNERVELKKELKVAKKHLATSDKGSDEYNKWKSTADHLNVSQHTIKILINSMYGYWGNRFSPLGDTDLARSITLTGQAVAKEAAAISERFVRDVYKVDTKMPIVVGGDTDSIYISVSPIMLANKWVTSISGKVTPEMYKVCAELEDYLSINITAWAKKTLNTIDPRFVFKRETICDTALFIEKKRYIAHVLDDEGIPTDKYKYIGISVVTTSVPKKLKPFIKRVAETMLQTKSLNETNKVYTKVYEDYKKLNVEDIATTRGISDYETSANQCDGFKTVKGMPVHVKSAYFYNLMLDQLSLSDKYEKIASGDKIKWYYCMPNRYKTQTMAYKEYLPEDIKVLFPVDTEIMFEKVIGSAVDILYTAAGWPTSTPNNQQSTNLADLFVE